MDMNFVHFIPPKMSLVLLPSRKHLPDLFSVPLPPLRHFQEEEYWWTPIVKECCPEEGDLAKPILSGKMSMLINILRESESVGDKVLVFSQSLASLDMIEEYLAYENTLALEVR